MSFLCGNSRITPDLRCGVSLKLAVPWRAVADPNLFLLNWDLFKQSPSLEIKKRAEWGMSSGPGSVRCFLMANIFLSSGAVNGIDTVGILAFNCKVATFREARQDLGEFENLGMRRTRFKSYRSLSQITKTREIPLSFFQRLVGIIFSPELTYGFSRH